MFVESLLRAQSRHRPQPAPAATAPADPRAELQRLFKSYDAAYLDFDADAVASLYDLPCLLSAQQGNGSFTARGELRAAFARVFAGYRQQGLTGASLASLTISTLSGDFAQARAIWSLSNARGHDVASFASHYTLRHVEGRWRVAHAVALDEAEKRTRQKPWAPILSLR